ncbi:hypothetical protein L2D08_00285 [Domibacillus sp. PGB-M46]|nr:hypothetical protein [Domibacillus sp. PGB-M46]MCI2252796.1 hypothetical protein [Domibacillus sp. PGB-M46]
MNQRSKSGEKCAAVRAVLLFAAGLIPPLPEDYAYNIIKISAIKSS